MTAALAVATLTAARAYAASTIFDDAKVVMNQPALLTKQATTGLFTSIARAGNRLVAVGQDGRVVLSDDNGATWRQVGTPTSVLLTGVAFATDKVGWATGQMGVVLHTPDGGEHWTMQLNGFQANQTLLAAAQAEVAAKPKDATAATDLQNAQQFVTNGPSDPFLAILPTSPTNLNLVGGYGMAFTSSDGGGSWQSILAQVPNPSGFHIYSIIKDGDNQIWAGEQGLVLFRDQTGAFKTIATPFQGSFFGGLRTPSGALILYGLQGTILKSTNDGAAWDTISAPTTAAIDCGIVLQNGDVLLGDENGSLLLSRDDGKTYSAYPANGPIVALAQAANGAIVMSGPQGIRALPLNTFGSSS